MLCTGAGLKPVWYSPYRLIWQSIANLVLNYFCQFIPLISVHLIYKMFDFPPKIRYINILLDNAGYKRLSLCTTKMLFHHDLEVMDLDSEH